ncbi:MAG: gliding motility-associated C-terminal domain-containing protein [Schleiferiaceae bacterium]|nr:gliding motility-associated C-terminal domain-containing protein [Schleiferiaceae bacterium]
MKKGYFLLFFLGYAVAFGQVPLAGSGNALVLNDFDNTVGLNVPVTIPNFPISVTAWVYADPSGGVTEMPIFLSKDDPQSNRGFQFGLKNYNGAWFVEFAVGDGTTLDAISQNARSVLFPNLQTWTHIAAVATGPQNIDFYVNGVLIPSVLQSNSGSGYVTTGPGLPRIGGSARLGTPYFQGKIDEVTVFNTARTQQEIRDHVCRKIPTNAAGLLAYFKFDEIAGPTFQNSSPAGGIGTATLPNRDVSGAAIGDISAHMYGTNLGTQVLNLITPQGDSISVENYSGNSQTIHIYAVNSLPNHFNGLPQTTCILDRYFGVYTTEPFSPNLPMLNSYLVKYRNPNYFGQDNYRRFGNDDPLWVRIFTVNMTNGFNFVTNYSREFILAKNLYWESNLPDSITTCSFPITLTADTLPGVPITWSTGATTASITINQGGTYWVQVSDSCNTKTDTIHVIDLANLDSLAKQFSLASQLVGTDCNYPITLTAPVFPQVTHRWPNGSNAPTYAATSGMPVYLELFSPCDSTTTDTLFLPAPIPWQSGLPPSITICELPVEVQINPHPYATIVWSTGDTGTLATAQNLGWLYAEVVDSCSTHRDSVQIQLHSSVAINPEPLADQWQRVGCDYPFTFQFTIPPGVSIVWHNGRTAPNYTAQQNETIGVIIYDDCDTLFTDVLPLDLARPIAKETQFTDDVCPGFPITLEPDFTAMRYIWSEGVQERTIAIDQPGMYTVYAVEDCDTLRNVFLISRPDNCPELRSTLYVPNAFTPNDDGQNDVFKVEGTSIRNFHMIIFNRWGQKVYESTNIERGWDGTLPNESFAQEGVYTYTIYYLDVFSRPQNKQGTITLMR